MKNKIYAALSVLLIVSTQTGFSQWSIASLSQARFAFTAASENGKVLFAGGASNNLVSTSRIDIYDVAMNQWSTLERSFAGAKPAAVAANGKIYIAGGYDLLSGTESKAIDVYNTNTGLWETPLQLSVARGSLSAERVGNKLLFAGGVTINAFATQEQGISVVDIYDLVSGTWTTHQLSAGRGWMSSIVKDQKAYFAGGLAYPNYFSKNIDIYDAVTNTWSVDSLSTSRAQSAAASNGDKIMFAGGWNNTSSALSSVDVFTSSGTRQTASLSVARMGLTAQTICGKTYFMGGGTINLADGTINSASKKVDIYDAGNNSWTTDNLTSTRSEMPSTYIGNRLFVGGGYDPTAGLRSSVEIYTCTPTGLESIVEGNSVEIFPNPTSNSLNVSFSETLTFSTPDALLISDLLGKVWLRKKLAHADLNQPILLDLNEIPSGEYFLIIETLEQNRLFRRFVVLR